MELGNCLELALKLVRGDRGRDYGRPRDDYGRTAALWSAYLGVPVTAEQAAVCMILVKVSRLAHSPGHTDSIIDIAGYAAVVEDCADAAKMDAVSTAADAVVQAGNAAKAADARTKEFKLVGDVPQEHNPSRQAAEPPKSRQALFDQLRDIAVELRGSIVIDWPTGIEAGGSTVGGLVKVRIEASMDELLRLDLRTSKRDGAK